ncbi:MAG: recombinase family protein, partial [Clostridia bacterium]|nr:recombinase family protein [Clostridia bacterium]
MYRCGIYLRTSKNVMEESNSIWMQEKIIDKYIEDCRDLRKIKVYIDEGVSGLTFARSGFINLMSDIEKQAINCVIVKDLSRLGRDYIQTGMYIQYIFPSKGVRLIAINDRYDSLNASEIDKYFMIPLRNYINDAYSRDISVKVRSSLYMKMKKGECVVSKVPFGYIKQGGKYV